MSVALNYILCAKDCISWNEIMKLDILNPFVVLSLLPLCWKQYYIMLDNIIIKYGCVENKV